MTKKKRFSLHLKTFLIHSLFLCVNSIIYIKSPLLQEAYGRFHRKGFPRLKRMFELFKLKNNLHRDILKYVSAIVLSHISNQKCVFIRDIYKRYLGYVS